MGYDELKQERRRDVIEMFSCFERDALPLQVSVKFKA